MRMGRSAPVPRAVCAVIMAGLLGAAAPALASGQETYHVHGAVVDSAGDGLNGAMVVALTAQDSVLTKFSLSDGDGSFTLEDLPAGSYILQVTLVGHELLRRPIAVTDGDLDAGRLTMAVAAVEMEELVVSVDHVPFINRRDTLLYNARAFETRPNATVEDLLRRMPGIEVDADGSIQVQGEQIQTVLVDGKEFFGSDPTIATRNLPADAVENVEIFDKQSDMAEFTGIPDGEEQRAINLELTEEARSGYFGQVAGALGSTVEGAPPVAPAEADGMRYDETFSVNRFSPDAQLAALGNINNVNRAGFSGAEASTALGGAGGVVSGRGRGGGLSDGFTESLALGVNGAYDFSEDNWLRGSYFFGDLDNVQNGAVEQRTLLASSLSSITDGVSSQTLDQQSHELDLNAQRRFAPGHDLRLRGSVEYGNTDAVSLNDQQTADGQGVLLNDRATARTSSSREFEGDASLTWRRRLAENGRSLIAEGRAGVGAPESRTDFASNFGIYDPVDGRLGQVIDQEQTSSSRTFSRSARLSLTEPLGERSQVEVFGRWSAVDDDRTQTVHDLDTGSPVFNDLLSSEYDRTYSYLQGGFRLNRNTPETRFVLGLQVQNSDLDGLVVDRDERITSGYLHVLPSADWRIELSEGKNLRVRYSTSTREPSIRQLQPFVDNSDPLDVYTGNPDLAPEYRHRLNADFRLFDQFSFRNLFTYVRLSMTTDNITTARTTGPAGEQSETPVNSGRAWQTSAGINFGTPIRRLGLRASADYGISHARETQRVNGLDNTSDIFGHSVNLGLENREKDVVDVRVGARLSLDRTSHSLNEEFNQSFTNATYYLNGSYYLGDAWTFTTSLNFRRYDEDQFSGDRNVALLHATVSRLVIDDRAEVQLLGFDLLNENQGVRISNTGSFFREERTQSLGQYLMLRFVWHMGPQRGGDGRGFRGRGRR